jgi:hypothetical protein
MADEIMDGGDLSDIAKSLILDPAASADEPDDDASDEVSDASPDTPDADAPDDEKPSDDESEEPDDASGDDEVPESIDDIDIDVVVDGETKLVKLKDLKAEYSGKAAIESRLQEVSEIKNKVLNTGNALYQTLNEQATRLRLMDQALQELAQPAINWEELRAKDPGKYLLEREKVREVNDRRSQLAQENARVQQQRQYLDELAFQEYADRQVSEIVKRVPELRDPAKAQVVMAEITSAAPYYGISQKELGAIVDHRHLMILADAAKWRKSQEGKAADANVNSDASKIKLLKARPLVKAGTTSQKASQMTNEKKTQLETLKRARSTGSVDDVAKLLMVRKK